MDAEDWIQALKKSYQYASPSCSQISSPYRNLQSESQNGEGRVIVAGQESDCIRFLTGVCMANSMLAMLRPQGHSIKYMLVGKENPASQ